jgi:hypothetical protein
MSGNAAHVQYLRGAMTCCALRLKPYRDAVLKK